MPANKMLQRIKDKISSDSHLKEMLRGSVITFAVKLTGMTTGYVLLYLISRKMGAEGVGYYSILNQFLLVCALIAGWGTPTLILRYIGEHKVETFSDEMKKMVQKLFSVSFPISVLITLVLFFFAEVISIHFFSDPTLRKGIQLVAISIPFFTLNSLLIEGLRGIKKLIFSEFLRSLFRPLFLTIGLLIGWDFLNDPYYIILLLSCSIGFSLLLAVFFLSRNKKTTTNKSSQFTYNFKAIFDTSSPIMFATVFGMLISTIDLFFVQYFCNSEQTGIYSIAVRFSAIVSISLMVINTISAPKFSRLYFENDMVSLQRIVRQSTQFIFLLGLITAILLIIFSPFILNFFGNEFVDGTLALVVLVVGQLINSATGSVGLLLNMSGNQNFLRNSAFASLMIQTLILMILVPKLGLLGAAIGSASASLIWNVSCVIYAKKKLGIRTFYLLFI